MCLEELGIWNTLVGDERGVRGRCAHVEGIGHQHHHKKTLLVDRSYWVRQCSAVGRCPDEEQNVDIFKLDQGGCKDRRENTKEN